MQKTLWLSAILLGGTAPLLAQGGDECTIATAITGNGPHSFDQLAATAGVDVPSCGAMNADVWFSWTASQTVDHIVSFCAGATHDTKIAVWDTCAGFDLACNDDACNLQSEVTFNAVSGTTYLFQVGTFGTVPGSTGTFTVTPDLPIINPANGHAYKVVTGIIDWQTAKTDAEGQMFQGSNGYLATITDQAELDWMLNNLAISRPWIGGFHNAANPNYAEPDTGWEWVTGEPFTFINWNLGEPNNAGPNGVAEDFAELFGNGEWNDAQQFHPQNNGYIIEWGGATSGTGTPFCNPMDLNSTGQSTTLTASVPGTPGTGIHLEATQGPPNQFGYFLIGTGLSDPGLVVSQGRLCLAVGGGQQFGRYNVVGGNLNSVGLFDAGGVIQNAVGTSTVGSGFDVPVTVPISGSPQIMAGQTWHFQLWHRENAGESNFSNGLSILF